MGNIINALTFAILKVIIQQNLALSVSHAKQWISLNPPSEESDAIGCTE